MVVGTGRDASLDRIVHFLGDVYEVPIQVVAFEVFPVESDGRILVREVTEAEPSGKERTAGARYTIEDVFATAKRHGSIDAFEAIYEFAVRANLYARPWKWSIMYTPQGAGNRALFSVWTREGGEIRVWIAPASTFSEFFPVSEEAAQAALGSEQWYVVRSREEAEALTSRLARVVEPPAAG